MAEEDSLAVLTFNIRAGIIPDGENAWPKRKALCAGVISLNRPAAVGLQEAMKNQIDDLLEALPDYDLVRVTGREGLDFRLSTVLYDPGRLRVLEAEEVWLSDTPDAPASISESWGNIFPRHYTHVIFQVRASGRRFHLFNTHWDHMSQEARNRSARSMRAHLAHLEDGLPVVLMGDLNTPPESDAFRTVQSADAGGPALLDSHDESPDRLGPAGTVHGFGRFLGSRIDHVLCSGFRPVRHAVIDTHEGEVYPSDHFPVRVDLVFAAKGGWF